MEKYTKQVVSTDALKSKEQQQNRADGHGNWLWDHIGGGDKTKWEPNGIIYLRILITVQKLWTFGKQTQFAIILRSFKYFLVSWFYYISPTLWQTNPCNYFIIAFCSVNNLANLNNLINQLMNATELGIPSSSFDCGDAGLIFILPHFHGPLSGCSAEKTRSLYYMSTSDPCECWRGVGLADNVFRIGPWTVWCD